MSNRQFHASRLRFTESLLGKPIVALSGGPAFSLCVHVLNQMDRTSRCCEGKDGFLYHRPNCRLPGSLADVHDPTINKQLLSGIEKVHTDLMIILIIQYCNDQ